MTRIGIRERIGVREKRILFLEALSVVAGGQQVLIDMLPALAGYDLHALLPGPGPLADGLRAGGVTCHFTPMAGYTLVRKSWADVARFPFDQIRLAFQCARLARRLRADLLYANASRVFFWATLGAVLSCRPVVWHAHNLLADRKTSLLLRWLIRWRTVRRVVAVSGVAAAQFPRPSRRALGDKVVVIPPGVDTALFRPNPAARARVRAELGISPDAPVVGIVGDLIPLKGQDTLLEAARLLPPAMASAVRLLVLGVARHGDGESHAYAAQLRAMADRNPAGDADKLRPSVLFAGRCDDLPAVLNAMDLLVVASDRETGPLVLLYAFASGVPVVSTPVGRAPELVQAGVTGELFPIGDAATLADRLAVLLDDSHHLRCMGQTARRLAEEQLSLAVFHTRIRGVIERTLEEI